MGNYILKNEKTILRLNNSFMDYFYTSLRELLNNPKVEKNEQLIEFIERLDQNIFGRGSVYVDIKDLDDKNKKLLKDLTENVVERIKQKREINKESKDLFIELLIEFKDNII